MMEKITFQQKTSRDYEGQFEVRDLRERNKFVVDDKFLNGYARFLGIYCVGVYNSLCRHANKEQKCWPSIRKMSKELDICRNMIIKSIKYLEFWHIIKKQRIGKTAANRYLLLDKKRWKPLNEDNLKEFSEVHHINFTGLHDKLQEFTTSTSIVRKHKNKETQKKEEVFFKDKIEAYKKGKRWGQRPYFWDNQVRWAHNKWWVIENKEWKEFAGKESEIEWK